MHRWSPALGAAAGLLGPCMTLAAGTPAGTAIVNQADVAFTMGGKSLARSSNVAALRVAEVLDVGVVLATPARLVAAGAAREALYFTIANTGNGSEAYTLAAVATVAGDDFDPVLSSPTLVLDADASGDLGPADVVYVRGMNDPLLAPDEQVGLFLLADIPPDLPDGSTGLVRLEVAAATSTGAPGTVLAGAGDQGVDAVIGPSGALRTLEGAYRVGRIELRLSKRAKIADPDGGDRPVVGAAIEYAIDVAAVGTGTATAARIEDPIPPHTRYVPGSLRLDGAPLTDASDLDAGELRDSGAAPVVVVYLGDLRPVDPARVIEFAVTIE